MSGARADGIAPRDGPRGVAVDGQGRYLFTAGRAGAWNALMNKPLTPNATYEETVTGYEYTTDELGRVLQARGELLYRSGERNTHQQRVAGRPDRLPSDDGGHYFATVFNGPGEAINLTPMDANLNRGAWKRMENTWVEALKRGRRVEVAIDVEYVDHVRRPARFSVIYQIDNEPFAFRSFVNRPGGE